MGRPGWGGQQRTRRPIALSAEVCSRWTTAAGRWRSSAAAARHCDRLEYPVLPPRAPGLLLLVQPGPALHAAPAAVRWKSLQQKSRKEPQRWREPQRPRAARSKRRRGRRMPLRRRIPWRASLRRGSRGSLSSSWSDCSKICQCMGEKNWPIGAPRQHTARVPGTSLFSGCDVCAGAAASAPPSRHSSRTGRLPNQMAGRFCGVCGD